MTPVIEAYGITKRFPGVVANDKVDFTLEHGEIHALLGENGAGKSTLMNVIYSLYQPDEGELLVKGKVVQFHSPNDAIRLGIGMVHQHFMLVPVMTVTENIMLGVEETRGRNYLSVPAAALVGGALGYLLGGVFGLVFWAIAALICGLPSLFSLRTPLGKTLLGTLLGVGMAVLFEFLRSTIFGQTPYWLVWVPAGALIGTLAGIQWIDKRKVAQRIRALSEEYGLQVDPNARVSDLPVGAQQRVEIIKALYRNAEVLILDEPTAVLTPQEADDLFTVMRRLTQRGVSIIFITHKLREVLEVADRITVLRRGMVAGTTIPAEATRESLARMMVGREVILLVDKAEAKPGEIVLRLEGLQVDDDRHHTTVRNISFDVRAGEIVGIAGVQGNGQTELVEAITGLRPLRKGVITLLEHSLTAPDTRVVTALGSAHIPEDRQRFGLVLSYPVADNLILCDYYREPFSHGIILDEQRIHEQAEHLVAQFDIRTPSVYTLATKLSGGNQQKTIVARELAREPRLLIANQPTRGLDVGSIEFIHNQIVRARDRAAGVLLVSAELDEIMSLADRILVMYRGEIMADVPAATASREELGLLMAGVHRDDKTSADVS